MSGGEEPLLCYRPRTLRPGGRLEVSGVTSYTLRAALRGSGWKLRPATGFL